MVSQYFLPEERVEEESSKMAALCTGAVADTGSEQSESAEEGHIGLNTIGLNTIGQNRKAQNIKEPTKEQSVESLIKRGVLWLAAAKAEGKGSAECEAAKNISLESLSLEKVTTKKREKKIDAGSLVAAFGAPEIDQALPAGGLALGGIHEWYMLPASMSSAEEEASAKEILYPPYAILGYLAATVLRSAFEKTFHSYVVEKGAAASSKELAQFSKYILWVGKTSWPSPYLLNQLVQFSLAESAAQSTAQSTGKKEALSQVQNINLFSRCIFIDPPSAQLKLWSIETALRSPSVLCVVADIKNISMSKSRRLALAAKKGGGVGLLVRPFKERGNLSAAHTRWSVRTQSSDSLHPRWMLELLKQKGAQSERRLWQVEFDNARLKVVGEEAHKQSITENSADISQFKERKVATV